MNVEQRQGVDEYVVGGPLPGVLQRVQRRGEGAARQYGALRRPGGTGGVDDEGGVSAGARGTARDRRPPPARRRRSPSSIRSRRPGPAGVSRPVRRRRVGVAVGDDMSQLAFAAPGVDRYDGDPGQQRGHHPHGGPSVGVAQIAIRRAPAIRTARAPAASASSAYVSVRSPKCTASRGSAAYRAGRGDTYGTPRRRRLGGARTAPGPRSSTLRGAVRTHDPHPAALGTRVPLEPARSVSTVTGKARGKVGGGKRKARGRRRLASFQRGLPGQGRAADAVVAHAVVDDGEPYRGPPVREFGARVDDDAYRGDPRPAVRGGERSAQGRDELSHGLADQRVDGAIEPAPRAGSRGARRPPPSRAAPGRAGVVGASAAGCWRAKIPVRTSWMVESSSSTARREQLVPCRRPPTSRPGAASTPASSRWRRAAG